MDIEGALKDQFFRPLIRTIVPGAIATAPWVEWVAVSVARVDGFRDTQPLGFFLLAGIVAIAAGLVLEDLGSRLETSLDGWESRKECKGAVPSGEAHQKCWKAYLALPESTRTHADDYLDSILLRFKFELAMVPSLLVCAAGLTFLLASLSEPVAITVRIVAIVAPLLPSIYLAFEAKASWLLLHGIRQDIVDAALCRDRATTTSQEPTVVA